MIYAPTAQSLYQWHDIDRNETLSHARHDFKD